MVKILSDGYGLTKDAAMWSVVSWCLMMSLNEVAQLIESTLTFDASSPSVPQVPNYRKSFDLKATYLAGTGFHVGKLKIQLDGKMQKGECTVSISKSPKRLRDFRRNLV